ncbi:MAG TPA: TlpA disulfide reductase family protein [Kiritimatiellia bacterium]|nr:TlpA disulfide reductase family protein [Kiritimatiellia bacterium]
MIKRLLMGVLLTAASVSAFAYSSLNELLTDMNRKQVDAIREYIAANPSADDAAEARERLVYGLVSIDDFTGAVELLLERYSELPEDKSEVELSYAFGEIVVPVIQLYKMDGRKDDALAFIGRVREDFSNHQMADIINETLEEFAGSFDQPAVGDELEIEFTAIDGREVNLADLKGKVVLVDFWATWCLPCIKAMPDLMAAYDEFKDQGFEIIGISLDSDREKLEDYLSRENIAWPQYFDGEGWDSDFARRYRIDAIPATFLIGRDGLIAATDIPGSELKTQVAALLAQSESSDE